MRNLRGSRGSQTEENFASELRAHEQAQYHKNKLL